MFKLFAKLRAKRKKKREEEREVECRFWDNFPDKKTIVNIGLCKKCSKTLEQTYPLNCEAKCPVCGKHFPVPKEKIKKKPANPIRTAQKKAIHNLDFKEVCKNA